MLNKKNIILILVLTSFLFITMDSSFAINNETTDISSMNIKHDDGTISSNIDDDKLLSSNDYYFDSNADEDGNGLEDKPYKDLDDKIWPKSVNHLKNGNYHLQTDLDSSDITFIGEDKDKTIINCNSHSINITKNLKLINITLKDFTINNEKNLKLENSILKEFTIINTGTINAETTIFDGGYGESQDEYGNSFGGAIYTPFDSKTHTITINNCIFKDCYAEYGGAIYMDGGILNIINSTFINNKAYHYGGAIACEYNTKLNINKTKFINDKSINDAGGAIYLKLSELNARNIEITNSTATFGAAITTLNSKINLYKLTAKNNTAQYEGGAIYQLYGETTIQQSNLINNTARNGGALFLDNTTSLILSGNSFENNTAKITAGAYYLLASPKTNFINQFINNHAQYYNDTYETPMYDNLNISHGNYEIIINNNSNYTGEIPDYYNLKDYGLVSSIKNQQYGGNCWAFAAMAALESCILKATGKEYDLSEENMKNLIQRYSDYGLTLDTNDGGYISTGMAYLTSWLGPINEINDTYDDYSVISPLLDSLMHIQNIVLLKRDNYTDNKAIKEAILKYGAVATGICYYKDYLNPITNAYYCPYGSINHAVTIVGWDDNYSKDKFYKTPKDNGAWIVKNSWGSTWGDDGYFYVSYYDWCLAKVGMFESSFTFILNDTTHYDKNYQYDIAGKTSYFAGNDTIWYQNIFTATDNEYLSAVSTYFETESNWTVSILIEDVLKFTKTGSTQAGYYTIKLDQILPLNIGDTFKIIFKVTSIDYSRVPISEKEETNKFLSKEGISYFSYDGETWHDLYNSASSSVACIKAFTQLTKLNSKISLTINSTEYNPVEIIAKAIDEYGRTITKGNISFIIENQEIKTLIINGTAKLTYNFKNMGLNNITAIFNEVNYNPSTNSSKFDLKKKLLNMNIDVKQDKNTANIILSANNNIDSKIKVLINNLEYNLDLVKGLAKLDLTLNPGDYNIQAILEDYFYIANTTIKFHMQTELPKNDNSNEDKINTQTTSKEKVSLITKKITTVKKSAKKIVLKVKLKIGKKAKKDKIITILFKGKKYKAKTNKKGIAKIIIKKSTLKKLKIGKKYKYTIKYANTTVKRVLKVKK